MSESGGDRKAQKKTIFKKVLVKVMKGLYEVRVDNNGGK